VKARGRNRIGIAAVCAGAIALVACLPGGVSAQVEGSPCGKPLPPDAFGVHFAYVNSKSSPVPAQLVELPSDVTRIHVSVTAGWGGQYKGTGHGGPGGALDATLTVPAHACVRVWVGGYGHSGGGEGVSHGGARGRTDGPGSDSGGGGGSTMVAANGTVEVVVGGGGGGGGNGTSRGQWGGLGGAGGTPNGSDGADGDTVYGGRRGRGGSQLNANGESGAHNISTSYSGGMGGAGGAGAAIPGTAALVTKAGGSARDGLPDESGYGAGGGGGGGGNSYVAAGVEGSWHHNPGPCPIGKTPATCNGSVTISWLRNSSGLIVPLHPAALPLVPTQQSVPLTPNTPSTNLTPPLLPVNGVPLPVYPAVRILPTDLTPAKKPVILASIGPGPDQPVSLRFLIFHRRHGKFRLVRTFTAVAVPSGPTEFRVKLPAKVSRAIRRSKGHGERLRLDVYLGSTGQRISRHQLTFS
jgi:hypothetical protein